jgi:hypothetical protein
MKMLILTVVIAGIIIVSTLLLIDPTPWEGGLLSALVTSFVIIVGDVFRRGGGNLVP